MATAFHPANAERVFERFYRRSNDASGSGLGLAIVAWIVNAHGGRVTVDSAPIGGARFVAAFPRARISGYRLGFA